MRIMLLLLTLYILNINAGPAACGAVCTTCCSAEWFWIPAFIPACMVTCAVHCIPNPMPPVPTPVDIGAFCQIAGKAAGLLPTP